MIEIGPHLGWQSKVLMTEKYHAVFGRLVNPLERNRILVKFYPDDLSASTLARSIRPILDCMVGQMDWLRQSGRADRNGFGRAARSCTPFFLRPKVIGRTVTRWGRGGGGRRHNGDR